MSNPFDAKAAIAPEASYGSRVTAKAIAEQTEAIKAQTAALETIAAEFQRLNDRKARRDVHLAYASARRVEEYNRQTALNDWHRPSHMAASLVAGPAPEIPVGKTDPVTGRYVPATEAGQQQLEQMLGRMLNPPAEVKEWREKQSLPPA